MLNMSNLQTCLYNLSSEVANECFFKRLILSYYIHLYCLIALYRKLEGYSQNVNGDM